MNPARYFSSKYWAHRYFATRPMGGYFAYDASGFVLVAGAADYSKVKDYVGSGEVIAAGSALIEWLIPGFKSYTGSGGFIIGGQARVITFNIVSDALSYYLGTGDYSLHKAPSKFARFESSDTVAFSALGKKTSFKSDTSVTRAALSKKSAFESSDTVSHSALSKSVAGSSEDKGHKAMRKRTTHSGDSKASKKALGKTRRK